MIRTQVLVRKDKDGNTPFHLVAASGDVDIFNKFISYYEREMSNKTQGTAQCKVISYELLFVIHLHIKILHQLMKIVTSQIIIDEISRKDITIVDFHEM